MDHEFVLGRPEVEPVNRASDELFRGSAMVSFGLRAAALAGMVAPVAMVVGGLVGLLHPDIVATAYTTCCPLG